MTIIDQIRLRQKRMVSLPNPTLPPHQPEILYFGCIDARLDPIDDIGIPKGKALIHRTIAALVEGLDDQGKAKNISEAATVEFAVNVLKVKDIVIGAHTACGGLKACVDGCDHAHTHFLHDYLKPLESLKERIAGLFSDPAERTRGMEEATVKRSLENLMSYPFVREAVEKGELKLHGWVMNTASKQIDELNPATGRFEPMRERAGPEMAGGGNALAF